MRNEDYYDSIRDNEPCAQLATIIKLIMYDFDISRADFMVLLELHKIKEFTWEDFGTAELTSGWNQKRHQMFMNAGWIELYRAKDRRFRMYNIYGVTRKTTTMVRVFYDYLSGRKELPDRSFSKNEKYSSNRLTLKIKKLKAND